MSGSIFRNSKLKSEMLKAANKSDENTTTGSTTVNKGGSVSTYDLDSELFDIVNNLKTGDESIDIDIDGLGGYSVTNLFGSFDDSASQLSAIRARLASMMSSSNPLKVMGEWGTPSSSTADFKYKAHWFLANLPTDTALTTDNFIDKTNLVTYSNDAKYNLITVDFQGLPGMERKLTRDWGLETYSTDSQYFSSDSADEGILPVPAPTITIVQRDSDGNVAAQYNDVASTTEITTLVGKTVAIPVSTDNTAKIPLPMKSAIDYSKTSRIEARARELYYNGEIIDRRDYFSVNIFSAGTTVRSYNDIPNDRVVGDLVIEEDGQAYIELYNLTPYTVNGTVTLILM